MGYPTVKNFDISYIKRTLQNLDEFKGENNFTMLLNSLLGLLILPNEYNKKGIRTYNFDFLKQKITQYQSLKNIFVIKNIKLINENNEEYEQKKFFWLSNSNKELQPEEITLDSLINRIRNGIAHFEIAPTKDADKWIGIIIKNIPDEGDNNKFNMEVYLEKNELEIFAKFIANKYLQTIDSK